MRSTPRRANSRTGSGSASTRVASDANGTGEAVPGTNPAGAWPAPGAAVPAAASSKSRQPASKPRRFASTAIPDRSMAARNRSPGIGSAPLAAVAPSSTELSTVPARSATFPRSVRTCRRESSRTARWIRSSLKRPSPIALFSAMANVRWVDAMTVVRSGVIIPVWAARPASRSSDATRRSTLPGVGSRAMTGAPEPEPGPSPRAAPPFPEASRTAAGPIPVPVDVSEDSLPSIRPASPPPRAPISR